MKTVSYKSSLLYAYERQLLGRRGAKQKVTAAIKRVGATDTRCVSNGMPYSVPENVGEMQALIGEKWVSFRQISAT